MDGWLAFCLAHRLQFQSCVGKFAAYIRAIVLRPDREKPK